MFHLFRTVILKLSYEYDPTQPECVLQKGYTRIPRNSSAHLGSYLMTSLTTGDRSLVPRLRHPMVLFVTMIPGN